MKKIGTLKLDIDGYLEWIKDNTGDGSRAWREYHWSDMSAISNYHGKQYPNREEKIINFCGLDISESAEIRKALDNLEETEKYSFYPERIKEESEYMKLYGMKYELLYEDIQGRFYVFTGIKGIPYLSIPQFVSNIELYQNLDHLTVKELALTQRETDNGADDYSIALTAGLRSQSRSTVSEQIDDQKKKIEEKKKELDEQKDKMRAEIEAMKAEIEKQYQSKFELLYKKMDELKEMREQLENQLFVIDSEIYAYRLRSGEVIQFHSLKSGKMKPADMQITIFPKIRFLDEELGKWLAIYDFDGSEGDIRYFEDILKAREDLLNMMCPSDKGVSFLKISRDGLNFKSSDKFENQLEAYKKYHGDTIAVLMRNGENLWIAWTDEERITVKTDDAFLQAKKTTIEAEDERTTQKTSSKEEVVSRYFLYNILQGVLDKGELLPLPQKVNLLQSNDYIVISYADGWIETNPYGSLQDIIRKTNKPLKKDDIILSMSRVTRDDDYRTRYDRYNNDRGIGEKNRTHDVSMKDCYIYKVNKVVTDRTYTYYNYIYPATTAKEIKKPHPKGGYTIDYVFEILQGPPKILKQNFTVTDNMIGYENVKGMSPEQIANIYLSKWDKNGFRTSYDIHGTGRQVYYLQYGYIEDSIAEERHYYVSLEKDANWETGKRARANFEFYEGECMNLTFLNSKYILSAIMHRDVYGRTNHSHTLPYLNKALDYLKKREEQEREMLMQYTGDLSEDWMVQLSEWRLKHDYHRLTDTRSRKFVQEVYGG